MSDNPYENIFGADNGPDAPTPAEPVTPEQAETPQALSPESSEYSIDYSGESAVSESVSVAPAYADGDAQNSCEWYGDTAPAQGSDAPYKIPEAPQKQEQRKKKKNTPVALILVLCIVLSSVFGTGSAYLVNYLEDKNKPTTEGLTINQVVSNADTTGTTATEITTVQIVERTADAVVEITTESVKTGSFAQQYIQSGAGSGVIIDSTGYIVTNHHVIEGAQKITVTLRSGESYDAQLLGSDSQIDLALLKIEAQDLTAAVFGNSDSLKVGQRTVAIGNPLGQLGGSVTEGIISALDRDVVVDGQTMSLLQTDTAINPGNSGGGLFDAQGSLIGIVVAKSSGSEVEGLGFAIPVNDAVDVISDLKQFGYVRGRVNAGMEFIDVDSIQLAWMYGLSEMGCYVYSVDRGSNAESAGFKSGDLILSVDGTQVESAEDIEAVLNTKSVGDEIVFSVKRNNSTGELTLILEEYVPDSLSTFGESQNNSNW
ncbi:MAG: trypsin-like peptidase domain-containing protein [Ruminococcus sp.]|nr:trypsin-like peptidase domain-containing protein [Ruminococcus sp.]